MSLVVKCARRLAGVLLSALLVGCSHLLPHSALPTEVPEQIELANTPFFAQERYQCGPASLAMLLAQRGVRVSPDELVARVYLPERKGSVAPEMIATARSYGVVVYEIPSDLKALLLEVAAGNPVLVLQNLGLGWLPKWHYAVVVGYDLSRQQITLRSGTTKRHQVSLALFERTWQRAKRWGMIALKPGKLPASDAVFNYFRAAYGLEQTGHYAAALTAYRSGSLRWYGSSSLWLAQSNLEYRLGHFSEAEQTLRTAIAHLPETAELWNNLAYPLAQQGCRSAALMAVSCARQLAPDEEGFLQSYREISMVPELPDASCPPLRCPVSNKLNP